MSRHTNIKQMAIYYVDSLGLPIIPLCSAEHKKMSLNHSKKCQSSGKAPIIPNWTSKNRTSITELNSWFSQCEYINIGVPLGKPSGLIGIDIDGSQGEKILNTIAGNDLPSTWEFKTGNGRRILYKLPNGIETKKKVIVGSGKHEEFAIICDGQQTVLPPSVHTNGTVYEWKKGKHPKEQTIAAAPDWVLDQVKIANKPIDEEEYYPFIDDKQPTVKKEDFTQKITEGSRNNHLTKLAGSLLSRDNFPKEEAVRYLLSWNQNYCKPPLPEEEIHTIVQSIYLNENLKKSKKKVSEPEKKKNFRPTRYAKTFVDIQREYGYEWKYSIQMSSFFRCSITEGPWKRLDNDYVKSEIRKVLTNVKKGGALKWDTKYFVSEGFEALKSYLIEPDIETNIFDVGQHIYTDDLGYNPLDLVFLKNGVYNWTENKLYPWKSNYYTTVQLPVEYTPDSDCPHWKKALNEWVPEKKTIDFLQEYAGLCLIPDTSFRTAVFLYGSGANGKSMFIDAIKKLFGDALVSIPLHKLATRFEIAYIQNKLVNICGDIDARYISDTGILKALISGDTLRGEFKHGASFDFVPVCRLLFSSNDLPRVGDKTPSWYSRWKFIEFPHTFDLNPQYKVKHERYFRQEKSGILNWAIEGLQRLMENSEWSESKSMKESSNEYRISNDNVAAFINDATIRTNKKDDMVDAVALHNLYKEWAEEFVGKNVSVGKIEFNKRIKSQGFGTTRRRINGKVKSLVTRMKIKKEFENSYNLCKSLH